MNIPRALVFIAGLILGLPSVWAQSFAGDGELQKTAASFSQEMVELADKKYGVKLDWSDASVASPHSTARGFKE